MSFKLDQNSIKAFLGRLSENVIQKSLTVAHKWVISYLLIAHKWVISYLLIAHKWVISYLLIAHKWVMSYKWDLFQIHFQNSLGTRVCFTCFTLEPWSLLSISESLPEIGKSRALAKRFVPSLPLQWAKTLSPIHEPSNQALRVRTRACCNTHKNRTWLDQQIR